MAVFALTGAVVPPAGASTDGSTDTPRMLVMGNSYISGHGADAHRPFPADTESYHPGTTGPDNHCFRSVHSVGEVVARTLDADLTNVSCAASEPRHIDEVAQFDEGLQIDAVTADLDIVVLQVIGNPEFINVVGCVQLRECDRATLNRSLRALEKQRLHEREILAEIATRAPNADIYVMGAPQVVPRRGEEFTRCAWFLSSAEVGILNAFIETINAISSDNARRASATFVDLDRPGSGWLDRHDVCAEEAWVWGPRIATPQAPEDMTDLVHWTLGSYHPTMAGHQASARVLLRYLEEAEHPSPRAEDPDRR